MTTSPVKRDIDETTDLLSDTSSLVLCLPPPFKHKKLRAATSTTSDGEGDDDAADLFPSSQKRFINDTAATRSDGQVLQRQVSINKTPEDAADRDTAEIHPWQTKIPDAPPRPRTSTPVRPSMYNSYMADDEYEDADDGECADCGARADAAATRACSKPSETRVQRAHPTVKRLLNYGEAEDSPCSSNKPVAAPNKANMTSKVIPGGVLESCVLQLRSRQFEDTPRPGGLRRPDVVYGAGVKAGPGGAGHGAGPKFARRVAMFTDRAGVSQERRDKYSGLKRGAALHVEMSARKHIMLKK